MFSIVHAYAILFVGCCIYGSSMAWTHEDMPTFMPSCVDGTCNDPPLLSDFGRVSEADMKRCPLKELRWQIMSGLLEVMHELRHDEKSAYCLRVHFVTLLDFFASSNDTFTSYVEKSSKMTFKEARKKLEEAEVRRLYCTDDKIMERFRSISHYAAEEGWITGSPQSWTQDTKEIKDKSKQDDIHHLFFCITEEDERHPRKITTGRGHLSHYYMFSTSKSNKTLRIYTTDFHHWIHQTFIFTNII